MRAAAFAAILVALLGGCLGATNPTGSSTSTQSSASTPGEAGVEGGTGATQTIASPDGATWRREGAWSAQIEVTGGPQGASLVFWPDGGEGATVDVGPGVTLPLHLTGAGVLHARAWNGSAEVTATFS